MSMCNTLDDDRGQYVMGFCIAAVHPGRYAATEDEGGGTCQAWVLLSVEE